MNEYGNIKTGQFKNDPLSLAMASVPVFPPRSMPGVGNPFQNPSMSSAYGFNMDGILDHTTSLYNPPTSHLPNTTKMSSLQPDIGIRQISHSFAKPPPMIYHNFTPLSSCNIVTTNGFFNLNAASDMSKHSFEDVLNLPTNFSTDSSMNAQMMLPKTQYHEPVSSVPTDNRHYFHESVSSYVQTLNPVSHDVQMAETRKHSRGQHKTQSKPAITNSVPVESVHASSVENNSPLSSDVVTDNLVNNVIGDIVVSTNILSTAYCNSNDIYKCGFCELKVSSNEELLGHLTTHTSLLPYHCGVCGMTFSEGSQLIKHVQHSHAVKPPYACGLCTSAFHLNEELIEHIESHDKPDSVNKTKPLPISAVREKRKTTDKTDDNLKQEETELEDEDEDEEMSENFDPSNLQVNPAANTIVIGKDTNFSLRKGPSKIVMDDVDLSSVCTVIIEPSSAGGIRKKHLFKCNYCEKVCKDKGSLVSHVRTHTKGRPYECNICLAKFKQYAHLSDHIMTKHTKERPYVCDRCAKTFNRKSHLQDHIRLRHTEDKLYHCPECSATFQKRTEFSDHKRTHGKPPKYQCNMCPRQFRNVTDYERHIRSHTKEKRFECEVCHLTFGLLANAKKHMIKHNEERPFKCEVCPKAYHFEHDFKRHKLTHLKKKPFPCPDCYKSFKNASLLKKHAKEIHMKSEEDSSKKPFKCLTCRKRFRIQWDLDRHKKIHAKKKPFPCLYCYKSYGSEAMLSKHTKVHEGQHLPLYDHSKDIIEESETDTKKKKRGRKPKINTEYESKDQADDSDVDEKPKRRGRPSKRKVEPDRKQANTLKLSGRQSRQSNDSETDDQSAPSIKVTFRRKKLHKRKFHCPDCNEAFISKAMLDKHSKEHEEDDDDDTEEDNQSVYQSESTNESTNAVISFNENANDATSLKESSRYDRSDHLVDDTTRIDDSTRGEDITRDGETTWDNSSASESDENSMSELKNVDMRTNRTHKNDEVSHFGQISSRNSMKNI